jgi:hypothetical protein
MGRIIRRLKQLRLAPFDRGDRGSDLAPRVENPDALAASGGRGGQDSSGVNAHAGAPPGYVPPVDEGRPRH